VEGIMGHFDRAWGAMGILALALAFPGCRRPDLGRGHVTVAWEAMAIPELNPDPDHNPMSVVVRLYQMSDRDAFGRLTFEEASDARPEPPAFGKACLGRTEYVLIPDTLRTETLDLAPGTRYLGIVALFRRPDPVNWHYLVDAGSLASRGRGTGPALVFRARECCLEPLTPAREPLPGQLPGAAPCACP
jgi:type VI secretion system protein VasD